MIEDIENTVIVVSLDNYKSDHQETIPFRAKVKECYENEIVVKSLATNKEYELYYHQILEALGIEEIIKLVNLKNYGI
jgi:hypothetical protein